MPAGPPPAMQQRTVLDAGAMGGPEATFPGPGARNTQRTAAIWVRILE